jgi:hypothetical protein
VNWLATLLLCCARGKTTGKGRTTDLLGRHSWVGNHVCEISGCNNDSADMVLWLMGGWALVRYRSV